MTRRPRSTRAGVVSRDENADEHLIVVLAHPHGLISLSDDGMQRILTPSATVALIMALLDAVSSHIPARPGPISEAF